MASTGRRGHVSIKRWWLTDDRLTDKALRVMLWLDSHTDQFLEDVTDQDIADAFAWTWKTAKRHALILVELGLVDREQIARPGGGTRTRYTLHQSEWTEHDPTVRAGTAGSKQPTALGKNDSSALGKNDPPSIASTEVEESTSRSVEPDGSPAAQELCEAFVTYLDTIEAKHTGIRMSWVTDMDRLVRLDGRQPDDVIRVLRWLATGTDSVAVFWRGNILSPGKLREQWDRMRLQYEAKQHKPPTKSEQVADHVARRLRETA